MKNPYCEKNLKNYWYTETIAGLGRDSVGKIGETGPITGSSPGLPGRFF